MVWCIVEMDDGIQQMGSGITRQNNMQDVCCKKRRKCDKERGEEKQSLDGHSLTLTLTLGGVAELSEFREEAEGGGRYFRLEVPGLWTETAVEGPGIMDYW